MNYFEMSRSGRFGAPAKEMLRASYLTLPVNEFLLNVLGLLLLPLSLFKGCFLLGLPVD